MDNPVEIPRKRVLGLIAACLAGLLVLFLMGRASMRGADNDGGEVAIDSSAAIIASVNGSAIFDSQLEKAREEFQSDAQNTQGVDILQHLIEQKLLSQQAKNLDLDKRPDIQIRLRQAKDNILANAMIENFVAEAVTDEELRAFYDAETKLSGPQLQIRARQVVLPDEATAKEVVRRLDAGDSFASIALAFSIDRASRESSGDLGYVSRDMLDPALTEKIFGAADNQRLEPFQTDQGWHIVEIMDRRISPVLSFEDRREKIRQLLTAQKLSQFLETLRQDADIDIMTHSNTSDE